MQENNQNPEQEEIITLTDENGKENHFYHVDTVEYKGSYYVALEAAEDMEGCMEGECIILRIDRDKDTEEDIYVEPEGEELDAVEELIVERMEAEDGEEDEDFEDDEPEE